MTVCRFCHRLERHNLGAKRFHRELDYRKAHGIEIGHGPIGNASIISAPQSVKKNIDRTRELGMRQTKQGNHGNCGINARIGVNGRTKVIHVVAATAVNFHDATCLSYLLHGEETWVWGNWPIQGKAMSSAHARHVRWTWRTAAIDARASWTK